MTSAKWTASDMPALDGRTVVVTGANSGLGLVAARAFGRAGAHVVLAVRNTTKGAAAAATVPGSAEVRALDLSDLASVRAFADGWDGDLDILVNNAGVMAVPQQRTKDGFELQIGTNHLGHFALTNLLLPAITDRVVTLSSFAHRTGKIRLDDLNWEHGRYGRWTAYGQSKLANLLFTRELQRRLTEAGSPVRALAAHPGYSSTNLQSHTGSGLQNAFMAVTNRVVAQSAEMGALPTLYAATMDLPGDTYVGPGGLQEMRGHPAIAGRSSAAMDSDTAARLWTLSEQLTGVTFPLVRAPA
jgi:NAD(P)-dependent dehydrogenase (short-subunit alcohol dehydrogenase family)